MPATLRNRVELSREIYQVWRLSVHIITTYFGIFRDVEAWQNCMCMFTCVCMCMCLYVCVLVVCIYVSVRGTVTLIHVHTNTQIYAHTVAYAHNVYVYHTCTGILTKRGTCVPIEREKFLGNTTFMHLTCLWWCHLKWIFCVAEERVVSIALKGDTVCPFESLSASASWSGETCTC